MIEVVGGLGLFLLGMIVMTEGLRALAGDAIRRTLIRFTRDPVTGALTGAVCTALLQSSSATTVNPVGFVAANLMSFSAALGIIFDANLGTTITGWMVALVGFKLQLGTMSLAFVFAGAVLRLFARGRWSSVGFALAGFGLIFVGIDALQHGMLDYRDEISFAGVPGDTWVGRLWLLGIGIVFTVIAQSSSAGVAATLTALFAGVVDFHQAAALVIGMDIGTTVTAVMASVGGTASVRRTGLSHVVYNVMTGTAAFFLIDAYVWAFDALLPGRLSQDPELALVAFHTAFNVLGVAIVVPFTRPFARLMERLVPGVAPNYTSSLDPALLEQPALAIDAVARSAALEFAALLDCTDAILRAPHRRDAMRLGEIQTAMDETQSYLDRVHLDAGVAPDWSRLVAAIHLLDHLQRFRERLENLGRGEITELAGDELGEARRNARRAIAAIVSCVDGRRWQEAQALAAVAAEGIAASEREQRRLVMAAIANGVVDVPTGTDRLDAIRILARIGRHVERILAHLGEAASRPSDAQPAPAKIDPGQSPTATPG